MSEDPILSASELLPPPPTLASFTSSATVPQEAENVIPVYNPHTVPLDVTRLSVGYCIAPKTLTYVPAAVANHAVGVDNQGGSLTKAGLRRLVGISSRHTAEEAAAFNVSAISEADAAATAFLKANRLSGAVSEIHDPSLPVKPKLRHSV